MALEPNPCKCFEDPKRKTFPLGAHSRYLIEAIRDKGPKIVGGPEVVELIKAHPNSIWCLGCGGIRKDEKSSR